MEAQDREIIVIGGGISGLTAAWHLRNAGLDVALLEAAASVGGCMRTERRDGFLLEKGPFNVMVRDADFEGLLTDLSDDLNVVTADPAARGRFIYRRGRLIAVPSNPLAFFASDILSLRGKCRALAGLFASRRGGDREYTLEEFAVRRFGREAAETLVSAVISGILAGDISRLSLEACFPAIRRFDRGHISPLGYELSRQFRKRRGPDGKPRQRRWRGLVSFDGGLGALCDALACNLGTNLLTGCRVDDVRRERDGFRMVCTQEDSVRTLRCRRLIVALPAQGASRLLAPLVPTAGRLIGSIESTSLVVLNLAFKTRDVGHPMRGYGFLVPRNEPDFPLMGVLWADSAFPHHGKPDHRLIRVMLGGTRTPDAVTRPDDALLNTASGALRPLLQIRGEPTLVDVCRYPNAIPQYHLGHAGVVARANAQVAVVPGLHLIGNYLEGVSINDCVRRATKVALEIIRAERSGESRETVQVRREFAAA